MEEAEALATNVAIMGTRMLAKGTLSSLQEEYGALYSVRAVRVPGAPREEVESLVRESFGEQIVNYEDRHGQVSFNLPHDKSALGKILKALEQLKGNAIEGQTVGTGGGSSDLSEMKVLEDYTLTPPTLEEVFMQVAREADSVEGV
jgi:ATP-binding cassette subfamily A (ABC1) protein 3